VTDRPDIFTVGELRAAGHVQKDLRHEIRDNLLAALAEGRDPWPGMFGFSRTVLPQLERALIAGHDVVLLGERGQGKTRLLRTLVGLLDEWSPVIEGSELNEHPYEPITEQSRARALAEGDRLRVAWRHRSERYVEKLATPDTSVADLIGDVDPMRVAEGRRLGDPETIHYGLVPRSNRGIIGINELPDLAERIQVAMLNVMEERDIQIRGYVLRLPLDVLVVASANPEDYTNRGRIITPLKDRFGAEIRTHYPVELDDEVAVIEQEGRLVADVPPVILEILARYTRALRQSPAINQGSGVSARFAIAGAETVAAAALRRATVRGEDEAVARIVDLDSAVDVLTGKIEFEPGEEGREEAILEHLLRTATAEAVREHYRGIDFAPLVAALDGHTTVTTGEQVTAREFLDNLPSLDASNLYDKVSARVGAQTDGQRAAAVELALEGLFLARRISKESDDEETIYG
jgi:magnesium chelatase subunit I